MLAAVISAGACHDADAEPLVTSDQTETPLAPTCINTGEPGRRAAASVGEEAIPAPRSASAMSAERCRTIVECAVESSRDD